MNKATEITTQIVNVVPHEVYSALQENPATNIVATIAVISPFWLNMLTTFSEISGLFMPILGTVWLMTQIYFRVKVNKGRR